MVISPKSEKYKMPVQRPVLCGWNFYAGNGSEKWWKWHRYLFQSISQNAKTKIAMFAPFTDEKILNQLSVSETIDHIDVHLVVIGQG